MRKGIEPIIASIILIAIVISLGVLVATWQSGFLRQQTDDLQYQANFKLKCQRSGIEIVSARFSCNNNCAAGTAHELNITVRNTGDYTLAPSQAFFKTPGGGIFTFSFAESVDAGFTKTVTNTSAESCSAYARTAESLHMLTSCPDVSGSLGGADVEWLGCP